LEQQAAGLCGMVYLAAFALFSARTAFEEGRVEAHLADWIRVLEALREDRLDVQTVRGLKTLNSDLDAVIREG
jgi:hypothetical protein